ncbi:reverse transcriptase domain-containing protein [Tanacetum coccineum]
MLSGIFQNQASTSGTHPSNTIPNPKGEMRAITTQNGVAYEGPSIPTNSSPKKVMERETEETTDKEQTNFQGSTAYIPPTVNPIPIPEPDVPKTLPKPNIPYPSRHNDQKSRDKASNQIEKIFQIFQDLRFDISFTDALLLMPRFAPTIKSLLMNKDKLFELAKIPLNENSPAMLLKKLLEKLGDPDKFLIPSRMTLELADRSITRPKGLAEDVFVKVGSFYFPTDFVVVDFEADPRVPLILGRSFLRTDRALIDVYEGELILRNGDERLIFHVDKHAQKHVNESIKMINFPYKDSFDEVLRLKKSNDFLSGSTTPLSDSRPSFTFFETSDLLLEDFADELALLDLFPPGNEDVDIMIVYNLERFTNEPSLVCLPPPGDECECNVPDSQTTNFSTFFNPLFDDSTSSNDESSHEEVTHEISFITYSNPLFDLDKEIISSEFNLIHNEDLDSTPKNNHFDAKSYLPESPLNHDTLIVFSPRNDPLHHEFAGELITNPPRIAREHEEYISRMWLLCSNSSSQPSKNFHASPNTIIESLPIFPIPVEDSDSHREEIDIFPGLDDLKPPEIERDDYHSEDDDNISLPEFESFHVDSTADEPVLLHTFFSDEDECFDLGGNNNEVDAFLAIEVSTYIEEGYYDSDGDVLYLERLLIDDTTHNFSHEVFFDHEPQCFKDEVLFTYLMNFLFSFGSEDTIFDPDISAFHFSSLEPMVFESQMEVCSSTCFISKDE